MPLRFIVALAVTGCVQTSGLGQALPEPQQAGDGDGDGDGGSDDGSYANTTGDAWLGEASESSGGSETTSGDDGIAFPVSWDRPLECGADATVRSDGCGRAIDFRRSR